MEFALMFIHRLRARWPALLVVSLIVINVLQVTVANSASGASKLGGWAYIDRNNDGVLAFSGDPQPEFVIGDVEIKLYLQTALDDVLVATTLTDQFGRYVFTGLDPGTYKILQTQPVGYVDGLDTVGILQSLNNQPVPGGASAGIGGNDAFSDIILPNNVFGDFYTFGERGMMPGYVSKRYLLGSAPILPEGTPDPGPNEVPEPASAILAMAAVAGGGLLLRRHLGTGWQE
jgi:hypothetical protein